MTESDGPLDFAARLLEQALSLPPAERAGFLDQACGRDAALRAMLDDMVRAQATGSSPQTESDPTHKSEKESVSTADAPSSPQASTAGGKNVNSGGTTLSGNLGRPGDVFGRYKLLERVGEGTFGEVWVAEQKSPVRRKVAIKIVKAGMDTREVLARFEAERQALAVMDHPNIARVFDAGVSPSGRPYFVMEHVAGVSIVDYCDSSRLRIRERLALFNDICSAVQHAHHKGVIHRDLKPANILVTIVDGKPVPKVIDFGIAKATIGRLTERTLYTETGRMIGTPEYMAPEQAGITGLDVDTRADVYSLGVILYELLTGTLPFDGRTLRDAGFDGIAKIIREVEPPKPSTRLSTLATEAVNRRDDATPDAIGRLRDTEFRALQREMRGDLDWITMRALEKDRARRYETPIAFAADVSRYLNGDPVLAAPPSLAYRAKKFARRHRNMVAAIAISTMSIAVVSAIGKAWWQERERSQQAEKRTQALEIQAADQARQMKSYVDRLRRDEGVEESEANINLRAKMASLPLHVAFDHTPLAVALEEVGRQLQASIVVNWETLDTASIERDTPITLTMSNAPADVILPAVLSNEEAGLDYDVSEGVISISTKEYLSRVLVTRPYDIQDLTDRGESASRIKDAIMNVVDPESWRAAGGNVGVVNFVNNRLMITQSRSAHRQIKAFLTKMRVGLTRDYAASSESYDLRNTDSDCSIEKDRRTLRTLSTIQVRVDFDGMPFSEAITDVFRQAKLQFIVNWAALETAGIKKDKPVSLTQSGSTDQVIRALFETLYPSGVPFEIGIIVSCGIVRISTTEDQARVTEVVIYPVRDILNSASPNHLGRSGTGKADGIGALISLIQESIASETWRSSGGNVGCIFSMGDCLVIVQTRDSHFQIASLLATLRAEVGGRPVRDLDDMQGVSITQGVSDADRIVAKKLTCEIKMGSGPEVDVLAAIQEIARKIDVKIVFDDRVAHPVGRLKSVKIEWPTGTLTGAAALDQISKRAKEILDAPAFPDERLFSWQIKDGRLLIGSKVETRTLAWNVSAITQNDEALCAELIKLVRAAEPLRGVGCVSIGNVVAVSMSPSILVVTAPVLHLVTIEELLSKLKAGYAWKVEAITQFQKERVVDGRDSLGGAYFDAQNYTEAARVFEETLQARRRVQGDGHPDTLNSMENLAVTYENLGRYADAEALWVEQLATIQSRRGPDHSDVFDAIQGVASTRMALGRYQDAEPLVRQGLEMNRRLHSENHVHVANALNALVLICLHTNRWEEADACFAREKSIYAQLRADEISKSGPTTRPVRSGSPMPGTTEMSAIERAVDWDAGWLSGVAWKLLCKGHVGKDEGMLALRLSEYSDRLQPDRAATLHCMGIAQYRCDELEKAIATMTRARRIEIEGEDPDYGGATTVPLAFLAMSHWRLGYQAEAIAELGQLRKLVDDADWNDAVSKEFLHEAAALIEGTRDVSGPSSTQPSSTTQAPVSP